METKQIGAIRIILFLFCPIVRGFLDIEELKNIKYGIDILNKPVLLSSQVCVLEKTNVILPYGGSNYLRIYAQICYRAGCFNLFYYNDICQKT